MKTVALIMAGGMGQRFWPKSRLTKPKQFLHLTSDGKTLLQKTAERLIPLVSIENIFIVTQKEYQDLVIEQLPYLVPENIIAEPATKNTAPCIGLAALYIQKRWQDAVMIVVPADHLIDDEKAFRKCLTRGIEIAQNKQDLVTIGITPSYPETGYGYIQYDFKNPGTVLSFEEKPPLEIAKRYLEEGNYLWNSGMFIWRVDTILDAIKHYSPKLYVGLMSIKGDLDKETVIKEVYDTLQSQSIDYAVMEKAKNIHVIQGDFGWDDVGTWLAMDKINAKDKVGNVIEGDTFLLDTKNCIIDSKCKLVATLGMKDCIVIDTPDVLMICSKSHVQQIKELVVQLERYKGGSCL